MPVHTLAIPAIFKIGKKLGGFFGKLFGGRKKRLKRRLKRQAAKLGRLTDAAQRIWLRRVSKLEAKVLLGDARAKTKLARIKKRFIKKGLSEDTINSIFGKDRTFDVPAGLEKGRIPLQKQDTIEEMAENAGGALTGSLPKKDFLQVIKDNPVVAGVALVVLGFFGFKALKK